MIRAALRCQAEKLAGGACGSPIASAASDRRCFAHSTDPKLVAERREARARGGAVTASNRAAERARRAQERVDLGDERAINVYLGIAAKSLLRSQDASAATAAAKLAELAIQTLEVGKLKAEVRRLEAHILDARSRKVAP